MTLLVNVEVSIQIIEKNGVFWGQVFDIESLNLIYEIDAATRSGCAALLGTFVAGALS